MTGEVALAVNIIGVLLMPALLFLVRGAGVRREKEYAALRQQTQDMHEDNVTRFERIENGLAERIARVEGKIDAHLGWHVTDPRRER